MSAFLIQNMAPLKTRHDGAVADREGAGRLPGIRRRARHEVAGRN